MPVSGTQRQVCWRARLRRLAQKIENVFVELSRDPKGKKMLRELYQIDGFVSATDKDYDSVRQAFIDAGIPLRAALQKNKP